MRGETKMVTIARHKRIISGKATRKEIMEAIRAIPHKKTTK
jgi:hypothetical protein